MDPRLKAIPESQRVFIAKVIAERATCYAQVAVMFEKTGGEKMKEAAKIRSEECASIVSVLLGLEE